ncbi:MAG: hypothetical protein GY947_01600 [Rhodobacteraceae bacterium]|nr:hypothetical protein [Paracoccaceae bacterium]
MTGETDNSALTGTGTQPNRKTRDSAALLPLLGIFLLLTPLISAFTRGVQERGIPSIVAYVFGVWIVLIVLAAVLARRLQREDRN